MSGRESLTFLGVVGMILATFLFSVHIGAHFTPTGEVYGWNPVTLAIGFVSGTPWPEASTTAAAVIGGIFFVLFLLAVFRSSGTGDIATAPLRSNRSARPLHEKARKRELKALHPDADIPGGQRIGRTMASGRKWVYQGWRDLGVCIFGPGRGKTSSQVVRKMIEAPGAAVMTSNKIDGIPEVLAARAGVETFVFDPQDLTGGLGAPHAFRFNPLSQVRTLVEARELAAIFEASTRRESDRGGDSQFDTAGRNLLAAFFFAAAITKQPLGTVFAWLSRMDGREAIGILRDNGAGNAAESMQGVLNWPEKTRGSAFATAQRMAATLEDDSLVRWTRDDEEGVRVFDPDAFVQGRGTLVLASKEGEGSGGALVAALVRAVCKAAEHRARANGGRLAVPLVIELDECANIVRWPELPSLYSFYGSLGIVVTSYFQSRAQGSNAFGESGMKTLWDSAGIRIYGGGSGDEAWLRELSSLIGEYDAQTHSKSYGRGGSSRSTQTQRRPRLDVASLAKLPEWQAVVFSGKANPIVMQLVPWWRDKPLAARIKAKDEARA